MTLRGRTFKFSTLICLILYYGVAYWLPGSYAPLLGGASKRFRVFLCRHIFKHCGCDVNIERKANFGSGLDIELGDESGLGINCSIPSNTVIGRFVMMGPNCVILPHNHNFNRTDIPMCHQGLAPKLQTIIGDDVWIGRDVLMTPGRVIRKGSIIAGGCVLCKNFQEYSIVGGNPSKLIRYRIDEK